MSRVPPYSPGRRRLPVRGCHPLWRRFPAASRCARRPEGLVPFRSPLLGESRLMSFPPGSEMFQFPGFASAPYVFRRGCRSRGGLPHSETHGSVPARGSPWLVAACRVLRRLSVPRHPPDALVMLDRPVRAARRDEPARGRLRTLPIGMPRPDASPRPVAGPGAPSGLLGHFTRFPLHDVLEPRAGHGPCARVVRDLSGCCPARRARPSASPARGGGARPGGLRAPWRRSASPARAVVEADGIEPTTSCLQSTRSPD
jgi:hypothetical protein